MLSPLLEGAFQFGGDRFALGAALQLPSLAAAEMERKGTFSEQALAQAEHFALTDYLADACRAAAAGRRRKELLRARRSDHRTAGGRHGAQRGFIGDAYVKELRAGEHKIVSHYDATFASDDPIPNHRPRAVPIRSSTASCAHTAAPSSLMRETNSVLRPT